MKKILANLIIIVLFTSVALAFGKAPQAAKSAEELSIEMVKNTKNKLNTPGFKIPDQIEGALRGRNKRTSQSEESIVTHSWYAEKINKIYQVCLKVNVQTIGRVETAGFSYAWNPSFIWAVDLTTRKVRPENSLARVWMETGKI